MPDQITGLLTPDEGKKVTDFLNTHKPACPVCGLREWLKNEQLVAIPAIGPGRTLGGGDKPGISRAVAHVHIHSPCGYTMLLTARALGISQG